MADDRREVAKKVEETIRRLRQAPIPPSVMEELGLPANWSRTVPQEFVEKIIRLADENKDVLRELAKY